LAGPFHPLTPLSPFGGHVTNGLWVLFLADLNSGVSTDITVLKGWSLNFAGATIMSSDVPQKIVTDPTTFFGSIESTLSINLPAMIVPITPGRGGDVRVHASTISLLNNANISANSTGPDA